MVKIRADIEIEVICAKCNNDLKSSTHRVAAEYTVYIEPCEACLLDDYNRGYNRGYDEAKKEGNRGN